MKTLEDLKEEFRYHPPRSQERIDAHNAINQAAFDFAASVYTHVDKQQNRDAIVQAIQVARMLANQYITLEYRLKGEQ
jgi:hypothetical protein